MSLKRKAVGAPAITPSASDLGHAPSTSSTTNTSKRVRIHQDNHGHHYDDDDDDDADGMEITGDLDLEEQDRKRNQPGRKGRIVTTGYDSDDDQEEEERRRKLKGKGKQGEDEGGDQDEDDDMFDLGEDDQDKDKAKGKDKDKELGLGDEKREARVLDLSEIEGQEFGGVTRIPGEELEEDLKRQEEEEEEMDPELELEKDSDEDEEGLETDDDENARGERTPSPIQADQEEDDENSNKVNKKKKKKLKKKGMGFKLDSFNMKSEYQQGRFDEDGNYLTKSKDPNAEHDSWLTGNYSRKKLKKAKEANERKLQLEKSRLEKMEKEDGDENQCKMKLVSLMNKGENVLEALHRVGKEAKKIRDEKGKSEKKKSYGKSSVGKKSRGESEVDGDTIMNEGSNSNSNSYSNSNPNSDSNLNPDSTCIENPPSRSGDDDPSIKALEGLTSLSSTLMSRFGLLNIYEETYESLLRSVRRSGIVSNDWDPASSLNEPKPESEHSGIEPSSSSLALASASEQTSNHQSSTTDSDESKKLQYRWSPTYLSQVAKSQNTSVSPEIEIFGPFEIRELKNWAQSGFFGGKDRERILLRELGGGWKSWRDVVGN